MIRLSLALFLAVAVHAAEFFSGQAARAVLGQPSFSSHDAGIAASAMTIQSNRLNVADTLGRVSIFDLSKIPSPQAEIRRRNFEPCPVCGFAPLATVSQSVAAGSSTVSMFGNRLAAIDTRTHRILIWHDVTSPRATVAPDVTLFLSDPNVLAVNESTIIDPVSVAIDGSHLFVGDAALHRVLVWKTLPATENQPADAVLGQPDFASREASDARRATTISRPDALVSDGANLFVGDSHDRRVLVFSVADAFLPSDSILNSASLTTGSFAPGTLVTVKGTALADQSLSAPEDQLSALPRKLGGSEVYLNGVALPLLSVSPTEIRAQLPYNIGASGAGSLYVRSERSDGLVVVTTPAAVAFSAASPGIFAFTGSEPRLGILLHSDDVKVGDAKASDAKENGSPVTADAPAHGGEVVSVWVTGLHAIANSSDLMPAEGIPSAGNELAFTPIHALVNGQAAEVVSATLPLSSIGVYQVKVLLPQSLNHDKAELSIAEDGYSSNAVTFLSQKP